LKGSACSTSAVAAASCQSQWHGWGQRSWGLTLRPETSLLHRCTPRNPACGICPLRTPCQARAQGTAPDLPRKKPKTPKPTRRGVAYVARRSDGAVLLETRPDNGLLGGMLGWPGSDWAEATPDHTPPCDGDWHDPGAQARHTFTHFHLILDIRIADVSIDTAAARGQFVPRDQFRVSDLPTVMRKVYDLTRD